ncbi:hypothetical protein [Enterococcus faecalis]|uniref:hypothetical protein n=1 Tax=Enterococcus TaxID=1350 RepID=UPI00070FBF34|nr:hypothetical protein [Enterococcus faecalis]EGP4751466.1 hypothetical protein [Enterococcus faecium]EGO8511481.1 hypothetical protein [Enterococcus faecalis]EME3503321.1 hypothetical protein [Enterococcus faecium]EME8192409.1 hypothetical protein [Enterococcus faecium]EMF0346910.1 hypothetical protein [Enterococcus faecium]
MDEKKERSGIKWLLFIVLYLFFFTPISLIGYQLTPYILEDKSIDLLAHIQQTLQQPIQKIKEIPDNKYWYVFVIMEIIGLLLLVFYLNPKKEAGYQVVGRTMPVHGSACWGMDKELRSPKNVHFRKSSKRLKRDLEKSMKLGEENVSTH